MPVLAQSQAETLADIRQEMSVLFVELQKLKREMSTTQGAGGVAVSGSMLDRVDAIEGQLQRLTARTEELENRITRIVADGTRQLGDLEFRLCELEPGCDLGSLGQGNTLGGGEAPTAAPAPAPQVDTGGGAQLAVSEQADFDRAKGDLDSGSFRSAAEKFAAFTETYPGGPLTAAAHILRGDALKGAGDLGPSARAYLDAFSSEPEGRLAPAALFKLGMGLNDLGQTNEACVTLGEVQTRFPDAEVAFEAGAARRSIGCP
ncbi:tol-pal system protein [Alphaproteobacteria bacterium KMM 3653]|uniref:Tol-pal system protein n=2 Tax=Harenicola maris TaxID=2841044 RepID=A0AAP2CK60_9RHOB|nr:tol-pal system protein [Harenicola maris]